MRSRGGARASLFQALPPPAAPCPAQMQDEDFMRHAFAFVRAHLGEPPEEEDLRELLRALPFATPLLRKTG